MLRLVILASLAYFARAQVGGALGAAPLAAGPIATPLSGVAARPLGGPILQGGPIPAVAAPLPAQQVIPLAGGPPPPLPGPICPPPPAQPAPSSRCNWITIQDGAGCIVDFECEPRGTPRPPPCPNAPEKPKNSERCNWIAVLDKYNCILEYECEPKPIKPCDAPPLAPDDNARCKWVPIKDHRGCIKHYECTPAQPNKLPLPRRPLLPLPLPAATGPLRGPLPAPLPSLPLKPAAPARLPPFFGGFNRFNRFSSLRLPTFSRPLAPLNLNPGPAPLRTGGFGLGAGDLSQFCCYWAAMGECDRNSPYMMTQCAQSCGISGCANGFNQLGCQSGLTSCPYDFPSAPLPGAGLGGFNFPLKKRRS